MARRKTREPHPEPPGAETAAPAPFRLADWLDRIPPEPPEPRDWDGRVPWRVLGARQLWWQAVVEYADAHGYNAFAVAHPESAKNCGIPLVRGNSTMQADENRARRGLPPLRQEKR